MAKVIVELKLTNYGNLVLTKRKPSVIKSLGLEQVDDIISQTTSGPK